MNVLVLNSGSSTLKFQVIATDLERIAQDKDDRICRGDVEGIGGEAIIRIRYHNQPRQTITEPLRDVAAALEYLIRYIASNPGVSEIKTAADVNAVGHRVVHGGEMFKDSALIDDSVLKGLEDCIDLAPLHNPNNIKGIQAARELLGKDIPQVAVFDTSFHHSLPEQAYLYAIPYHFYRRHRIRRYGFHGTSHRYVAYRYRAMRGLTREQTNIITLHLGNGCSAAAIKGGCSVDTSMGLTPLEGLVMGTRSGDVDPAVVSAIARKEGLSAFEVDRLLNMQSGLLGISGLTNDMRELQAELKEHEDRRSVWVSKSSVIGLGNTSAHIWLRWAELTQLFSQAASEKIRRTFVQEFVRAWSGRDFASTQRRIRRRLVAKARYQRKTPSCSHMLSRLMRSSS